MAHTNRVEERLEEGVREIGVLLVALAPLDYLLTPSGPRAGVRALLLAMLGIVLFGVAVMNERRRQHD